MRKLKLRVTLVGQVCWDSDPGLCSPRGCALVSLMPSLRRDGTDALCVLPTFSREGLRVSGTENKPSDPSNARGAMLVESDGLGTPGGPGNAQRVAERADQDFLQVRVSCSCKKHPVLGHKLGWG